MSGGALNSLASEITLHCVRWGRYKHYRHSLTRSQGPIKLSYNIRKREIGVGTIRQMKIMSVLSGEWLIVSVLFQSSRHGLVNQSLSVSSARVWTWFTSPLCTCATGDAHCDRCPPDMLPVQSLHWSIREGGATRPKQNCGWGESENWFILHRCLRTRN